MFVNTVLLSLELMGCTWNLGLVPLMLLLYKLIGCFFTVDVLERTSFSHFSNPVDGRYESVPDGEVKQISLDSCMCLSRLTLLWEYRVFSSFLNAVVSRLWFLFVSNWYLGILEWCYTSYTVQSIHFLLTLCLLVSLFFEQAQCASDPSPLLAPGKAVRGILHYGHWWSVRWPLGYAAPLHTSQCTMALWRWQQVGINNYYTDDVFKQSVWPFFPFISVIYIHLDTFWNISIKLLIV